MDHLKKYRHQHHKKEEESLPSIRISIFGDAKVGKTELLHRLFHEAENVKRKHKKVPFEFHDPYVPTIEDFHQFVFHHLNCTCALEIVDTSGSEQFPAMRRLNIGRSDLIIIMYDVGRKSTWREAVRLYEFTRDTKPIKDGQMVIFVGGKSDKLNDPLNYNNNYISKNIRKGDLNVRFSVCSAKTGDNIRDAFEIGLERQMKAIIREINVASPGSFRLRSKSMLDEKSTGTIFDDKSAFAKEEKDKEVIVVDDEVDYKKVTKKKKKKVRFNLLHHHDS